MDVAKAHLGKIIQKSIDIDTEDLNAFLDKWHLFELPANEFLVKPGKIDPYFYFVVDGVQKLYFHDKKAEEHILGFSFEGSFSGDFQSFLNQKPSQFYVETISASKFLRIGLEDWKVSFQQSPQLYQWYSDFLKGILFGRIKREVEMQSCTAEERFEAFMQRAPLPLLQIPQKYLASYLGMKPETFSRMRAKRIS